MIHIIVTEKGIFMTLEFKSKYLEAIRQRYYRSNKAKKTAILNELCKVAGYNRKYAIRILKKGHMTNKKNSGRTRVYSEEVGIYPLLLCAFHDYS
jgi:predicted transcriptional regulator